MADSWLLSDHITEHMSQARLGDGPPPNLWPSEGSALLVNEYNEPYVEGKCRRATYLRYVSDWFNYDATGFKDFTKLVEESRASITPTDKYMRWIWTAGNLFEDFVIEQAKQSGVYLGDQIRIVVPEVSVVGKLDLLVINPLTGGLIAEEIKSIYGHNSTEILGTPGMWNKKRVGKPRSSNLIQIALYDWHLRKKLPGFEVSRLFYGARDTGRFGEFDIITTLNSDTNVTSITYKALAPVHTPPTTSAITIDNVLAQYKYVLEHVANKTLPPRDFELTYSQEHIQKLYERDELGKGDRESHEKVLARLEENKALITAGKEPKKELKVIEKGDWNCRMCSYSKFCYNQDGTVRS